MYLGSLSYSRRLGHYRLSLDWGKVVKRSVLRDLVIKVPLISNVPPSLVHNGYRFCISLREYF